MLVAAVLLVSLVGCRSEGVPDPGFDEVESTLNSVESTLNDIEAELDEP